MTHFLDSLKNAVKDIDMNDIAKVVDIADDILDNSDELKVVKVEGMSEVIKTVSEIKLILAAIFKTITEGKS